MLRTEDKFLIFTFDGLNNPDVTDPPDYKVVITSCYLYVPLGVLTEVVYNRLVEQLNSAAIFLHYR